MGSSPRGAPVARHELAAEAGQVRAGRGGPTTSTRLPSPANRAASTSTDGPAASTSRLPSASSRPMLRCSPNSRWSSGSASYSACAVTVAASSRSSGRVASERQAPARSKPAGRRTGSPVGAADVTRPSRKDRSPSAVPATQVPAARLQNEAERVHGAFVGFFAGPGVAELDPHAVQYRTLQGRVVRAARRHGDARPVQFVDDPRPGRRLGVRPQWLRHGVHQLAQRRTEFGRRARGAGGQEQRPHLRQGEPGQVGARPADQPPSATPPALRVDGQAGGDQRLQVAPRGAFGDLQLRGELRGGHPAARLEEEQGRHQTVGSHQ